MNGESGNINSGGSHGAYNSLAELYQLHSSAAHTKIATKTMMTAIRSLSEMKEEKNKNSDSHSARLRAHMSHGGGVALTPSANNASLFMHFTSLWLAAALDNHSSISTIR